MRIVLATIGTRGDVQPMIALAQAAEKRGHQALLACPDTFGEWVRSMGVEHAALGEDLSAHMAAGGDAIQKSLAGMKQYFREQLAIQAPRLLELTRGADAIVSTAMAWSGPSVAEKLHIPALLLLPSSLAPSRLHPPPLFPSYGWPQWVNGLLWWASDAAQNSLMGQPLNEARAIIGLGPIAQFTRHLFVDTPAVIAADETFLPADPAWRARYPYSGFLFMDDPTPLDPALDAWLREGEPPVCVGFGSMAGKSPDRVGALLAEALSGRRVLVLGGSARLFANGAPTGFHVVSGAPHAKLFPRVSVVIHHGGSGTTAAALRAGVPQVILPMMLDQFHHAHHAARMQLAPKAPSLAKVTAKSMAEAVTEALALPEAPRRTMAERLGTRDAGTAIVERLEAMARGHLPEAVASR